MDLKKKDFCELTLQILAHVFDTFWAYFQWYLKIICRWLKSNICESESPFFVLQKCSRIFMTIELKLTFHVLLHSKYSMVNIITCFAGPTTWGQSRGLGTQQRPGPRSQDYLKNFVINGGERSSSWRLPELRGVRRVWSILNGTHHQKFFPEPCVKSWEPLRIPNFWWSQIHIC